MTTDTPRAAPTLPVTENLSRAGTAPARQEALLPDPGEVSLLLGPRAGTSCPVKTQNSYDPRVPDLDPRAAGEDEGLRELFAGTAEWTEQVCDQLTQTSGVVDLRAKDPHGEPHVDAAASGPDDSVSATTAALAAGATVVLAARLPPDPRGHRWSDKMLLVRGPDAEDGRPGYHPVLVRKHLVREHRRVPPGQHPLRVAGFADPSLAGAVALDGWSFRTGRRERDLVQLAHAWRLLQSCGHAAGGSPWGGLVGTDKAPEAGPSDPLEGAGVTWLALDEPRFRTFSRRSTERWQLRSALERHDHEHQFRVAVATRAQQLDDPSVRPMVHPIRVDECDRCQWWEHCRPQLDAEDISLRIDKAPLDVREISVLRSLGVRTTRALAEADLDALLPRYLPEVAHRAHAEKRLRTTARRAELISRGVLLDRLGEGPVELPGAELEVDLDIETSQADTVYLWGLLVTDTTTGERTPRSFVRWTDLDQTAEVELAVEAIGWLRELVETGRSVAVYHYSDYELVRTRQVAERAETLGMVAQAEVLRWFLDVADRLCVDLFEVVRSHLFGVQGLGLKSVATTGAGFDWRDADPGGLNSQRWFDEAVHGASEDVRAEARRRVLEYNEDDVAATAAVRRWLRSLT